MKSDIDQLMADRNLDAFIVFGGETANPHRAYLTGGHEANSTIFKKRGEPALLITNPMEVDNAKKSGLEVVVSTELKLHELYAEYKDDRQTLMLKVYERFFERAGISEGRVGVYGFGDIGRYWETLHLLREHFTALEFVGERERTLFAEAVITKDADEIAILKDVGARTNAVMAAAWDFIASHRAEGDTVVKADGQPLTIGDVKRFVRVQLLEHDLEDPEGMIFAQGADGGIPHHHGTDTDALKLGQAIVFDLFPRDMHTGYFHDMTRTWSIGYAAPEVQKAYDEVMMAFNAVMDALTVGDKTQRYQLITLDVLEEFGHPTARSEPGTTIGYMHSLGHGLGLEVHERPSFSHLNADDVLQPGNVFTVEPGVYYPERGYGIRVEDTVYIDDAGVAHSLTPMRKDLVLALKG